MIHGIGTDIVSVARIDAALERFGNRFAEKILSSGEQEEFLRATNKAAFLAKRFAAKEAMVKALGTGFRDGITLQDIAVSHDSQGKPIPWFSDSSAERIRALGIATLHLSIADERDYAIAYATAVAAPGGA